MHDFTKLSEAEVVQFLVNHIEEFTSDPDPSFPNNIEYGFRRKHLCIKAHASSFAVVAHANRQDFDGNELPPELVFLYTSPEIRGTGAASLLIQEVKDEYIQDQPMRLLCCGEDRRRLFERNGFVVDENDNGTYTMICPPIRKSNSNGI